MKRLAFLIIPLLDTEIDLSEEDMQRSAVRETCQADRVYAFQPAKGAIQRHHFQHRADHGVSEVAPFLCTAKPNL